MRETLEQEVISIFKRHGGVRISPTWLDKDLNWEPIVTSADESHNDCERVMFTSGVHMSLPYDLRLAFAKYIHEALS